MRQRSLRAVVAIAAVVWMVAPCPARAFEPITCATIACAITSHSLRIMERHGVGMWSTGGSSRVCYKNNTVIRCPKERGLVPLSRALPCLRLARTRVGFWLAQHPIAASRALLMWAALENEKDSLWVLLAQDMAEEILDAVSKH